MTPLKKGDYVLATKYCDGDPYDGYAVGFFDAVPEWAADRFLVMNSEGKQYRASGFRRCERISHELGNWIVANRIAIEALTRVAPINMWRFRQARHRAALEAMAGDPLLDARKAQIAREAASMGSLRPDEQHLLGDLPP